jgi:hypothetical protein
MYLLFIIIVLGLQNSWIPPTYGSFVMFIGFLAYPHHSPIYPGCVFVLSRGRSVQLISPFLHFCKKWGICNTNGIGPNCRYARKHSYLGELISAGSLHISQVYHEGRIDKSN